jgi:hypothetical protein
MDHREDMLRRAAYCRQMADRASTPQIREMYRLAMEDWLRAARLAGWNEADAPGADQPPTPDP